MLNHEFPLCRERFLYHHCRPPEFSIACTAGNLANLCTGRLTRVMQPSPRKSSRTAAGSSSTAGSARSRPTASGSWRWKRSIPAAARQPSIVSHIIERVRLFAREAGKPEIRPVDVNDVMRTAVSMVGAHFRVHGILLACELADTVLPVSANPYSLEEVLVNVLTNARDAVPEKVLAGGAGLAAPTHRVADAGNLPPRARADGDSSHRQGHRHPGKAPRQGVQTVLHHQRTEPGNEDRTGGLQADCGTVRRHDQHHVRGRPWHHRHRLAPGRGARQEGQLRWA